MFLDSAVSSPLDHIKALYTSPPGRYVHSDTNYSFIQLSEPGHCGHSTAHF